MDMNYSIYLESERWGRAWVVASEVVDMSTQAGHDFRATIQEERCRLHEKHCELMYADPAYAMDRVASKGEHNEDS